MAIVIIEGQTGDGKTTFRTELSTFHNDNGTPVEVHFGSSEIAGKVDRELLGLYLKQLDHPAGSWLIADRLHFSNYVYGTIFRGRPDLAHEYHWMLEGWLLGRGCVVVYLDTALEHIRDTQEQRASEGLDKPPYDDRDKAITLKAGFLRMLNQTQLPVIPYNRDMESMVHLAGYISHRTAWTEGRMNHPLYGNLPVLGNPLTAKRVIYNPMFTREEMMLDVPQTMWRRLQDQGWTNWNETLLAGKDLPMEAYSQWIIYDLNGAVIG